MTYNVKPGEQAPAFTLTDVYGKTVSLHQFLGRPVLIVFARHLGCLLGRAYLSRLRKQYGRIQHAGGEVVVISFETPDGVKKMIASHKFPFIFLHDPQKNVYNLYEMLDKRDGAVSTWRTALAYIRLRIDGFPPVARGTDTSQMGGIVMVDKQGIIRLIYRSAFPEDWPDAEELVQQFSGLDV